MDQETLRELAEQKEKEWRVIQEKRIEALESSLRLKTNELAEEKQKFKQLKEDFKYNLKLLEDRDKELDKFEQSLVATRKQLADKNGEISELKIKLDELKKYQDNEKNMLDECKKYYLNRLNQKQNEIEKYKAEKDTEINQERNEIEKFKRTLQRQIQDLQFDLDKQRNELKTEFDSIIRKREHEWRLQADEFSTITMAKDLEIKMLNNELNQLKEINQNIKSSSTEHENDLKTLEKKLKEKEWELKDTVALKDAKIKEMEIKSLQFQSNLKNTTDEMNRKLEDSDKLIRDREISIKNLKETLNDEEKKRLFLEQQIEEYRKQIKHLNFNIKQLESKADSKCADLNQDLNKLKLDLNKEIEEKAKQVVSADINIEELNKEKNILKSLADSYLSDIESLKKQLDELIAKQDQLEHEKLEINLDWQRKYNALERLKSKDSEDFTRQIMESRDQALDKIKLLEDKLYHKENVIKALQTADPTLKTIDFESSEFKLKEENEKLKQIIKQMRTEMENIASDPIQLSDKINPISEPRAMTPVNLKQDAVNEFKISSKAAANYDDDLKQQLLEAKQKNRQLQSQIDDFVLKQKLPDNITDNTIINNHIKSLNETINLLRKEKVDLTAYCKKQQTREIHIDKKMTDLKEELRLKQTQLETLQYEMSSQTRRSNTEISNLKQTIANMEIELNSTRKEADEYHKAVIEKNSEIAGFETKITELKLKLSTSGTQINFGAQELFIQQLQDEIKRVNSLNKQLQIKARQQNHQSMRENLLSSLPINNNDNKKDENLNIVHQVSLKKEIESLKSKLKTAAKFITQLVEEKEKLIELSNELRGKLNKIQYENETLSLLRINRENIAEQDIIRPTSSPSSYYNNKSPLANKLQQLEQKQYDLTKKQLAFAQQNKYNNNKTKTKSDPTLAASKDYNNYSDYKSSNYKDSESTVSIDDNQTVSSSIKSENLRDIWKLLDQESSNFDESLKSNNKRKNDPLESAVKVTSIKPIKQTSKSPRKQSVPISARDKPKPKIRNYNIKD